MGLFGSVKGKKSVPLKSSSGLGAGVSLPSSEKRVANPIPKPPEIKKAPEDLPKFPVDMSGKHQNNQNTQFKSYNTTQPKELPRLESEKSFKNFVSSDPSKPFFPEFEEEDSSELPKPTPLRKIEKDLKSSRLFEEKTKPIDKKAHFELHNEIRRPLFIRTDQYKDVRENTIELKKNLEEIDETYYRIDNLMQEQESEFNIFKKSLEDIQRKLIYVDKTIFEKGGE